MGQYIILDRDGVINQDSDAYIKSPDEWHAIPGSLEAIARIKQSGFHVAVATNQSGISRGLYDLSTLNAIHQKMTQELSKLGGHIDFIAFCPHQDEEQCDCRKPLPGLYERIAKRWNISLDEVPVIGDSRRDLEAAVLVKAKPVLVRTGKGKQTRLEGLGSIPVYDDLKQAVDQLLAQE